MEIKTEADSNDITECPHDDKTKPGRFVFSDPNVSTYVLLC